MWTQTTLHLREHQIFSQFCLIGTWSWASLSNPFPRRNFVHCANFQYVKFRSLMYFRFPPCIGRIFYYRHFWQSIHRTVFSKMEILLTMDRLIWNKGHGADLLLNKLHLDLRALLAGVHRRGECTRRLLSPIAPCLTSSIGQTHSNHQPPNYQKRLVNHVGVLECSHLKLSSTREIFNSS